MNWSTKPSTRHWLKATPLLWLALAAPASAAILPGAAVDGPSNLIENARPDIDVAPDGSAALVYLKNDGGANHPFVSRFAGGAWGTPQRVDTGSGAAASNPRIAVANGGKVVVTYISGGDAVARISSAPGAPFGCRAHHPGGRAATPMSTCPRAATATPSPSPRTTSSPRGSRARPGARSGAARPRLRSDARSGRKQPRRANRGVRRRDGRRDGLGRGPGSGHR